MNIGKFSYLVKQNIIFCLGLIAVLLSKPVLSVNLDIAQTPLAVSNAAPPRVMLAMSRDHQLYIKAYTDYTDLDGDGMLEPTEITYNNSVDYYGYFDSNKCYNYNSGLFVPVGQATAHQCSKQWSGNFLNWASMTRMDIIRKVLYGGYRSTDGGYGGVTILERAMIPYDLHAFVKVFSPGSAAEMEKYTPYDNQTVISICNLTQGNGLSKNIDTMVYPPLMRIAGGSWPGWAASKNIQCQWGNNNNNNTLPGKNNNLVNSGHNDGLNVRVNVCIGGLEETNCKSYTDLVTGNITKKPTGLLQKYWDLGKPISFGLMTGSWGKNKSGGVLRKILPTTDLNLGEVMPNDGTFNLGNDESGGIIATLDHFRISDYNFDKKEYNNCSPGNLSFNNGECVDWGNPLSEIYLETLRYLAGKGPTPGATTAFNSDDSGYFPLFSSPSNMSHPLNQKSWDDPILEGNWCARCSIVVISTGLNSFDTDELSNDLGINAANETDSVGTLESISGNYLIGSNGSVNNKQCTGKTLSGLSAAQGICPEVPSQEGGYDIAGLAYYARTHDFRPEYTKLGTVFFPGVQSFNTYSVALAESLPRFQIPAGSGIIAILPTCVANSDKNASSSSSNWRPCSMTNLMVENLTYDSGKLVSGSFTVNWEDSTWGSNYDMDGIERLEFCVGSACSPGIVAGKIKITASVIQAESDQAMRFGYTITGSTQDGIKLPVLRPGKSDFNVGDPLPNDVTGPIATEYSQGVPDAKLLENPLWYAAKYGGFDTIDTTKAEQPEQQSWDEDANGIPDAFFKATNPTLLESALDEVLSNISSKAASSASVAANSTRLDTTVALYQATYNPSRWNGQLLAYKIDSANGNLAQTPAWDAGEKMSAQSSRSIFSYNEATKNGVIFEYGNLSNSQKLLLTVDQLNYIKGDQSKEKPAGTLRTRIGPDRLMGDIINSDPEFINTISQGYDTLPVSEGGSDYLKYITSSAFTGRAPMLAVGANDGMLHVFDASFNKAGSGKEIAAYVPSTIISKLHALTLPTYIVQGNHQYFVDGSPNAGDVYFDADGDGDKEWRTALVGTLGAGGKGVFALDMTFLDPNDYNTAESQFLDSRVLWEINDTAAPNAADLTDDLTGSPNRYGFTNYLGLTMGQASIVKMANGQFAAVFGNGYNSVSQTAVLYIVDIKTGYLIRSITTGVGDTTTVNGLATPLTVDANDDHIVDAIYAGDYLGNMWKFDVSDPDPNKWKVAFTSSGLPAPLFTAMSAQFVTPNPLDASKPFNPLPAPQKITAKPQFGKHPNGGVMLYFGTGKYILNKDTQVAIKTDPVETFYGIWDQCVNYARGAGVCNNAPIAGKSELVQQTIDYQGVLSGSNVRVTSGNAVNYSIKKGWYMELIKCSDPTNCSGNVTGEKVISQALLLDRRIIFPSIVPARGACSFGGNSWLMLVDALTGKNLDTTAFDVTGSGTFNDDQITYINNLGVQTTSSVSGIQSKVGMIDTPAVVDTDGTTQKLVGSGSSGQTEQYTISKLPGGRQCWLQIR